MVMNMKRIRELRESKGISQQKLAAQLNVTQAVISKYELGISEPDIAMIQLLSKFFGVSSDYLLEISDDKISLPAVGLSEKEKDILFGFKRPNDVQKEKLQAYLKGLLQE